MQQRRLGESDLRISVLGLGTLFGGATELDEDHAFGILDRAVEAGISFVDVADPHDGDGRFERCVGAWLARSKVRRRLTLATRYRFRTPQGGIEGREVRRRLVSAAETSLIRLGIDQLDLIQIGQDLDVPEEETLAAMDDLVRSGKVRHCGASFYSAYRLADSLHTSERLGLARFVSVQIQHSLLTRTPARDHAPIAAQFGLGLIASSPLAGGFLAGRVPLRGPPTAGAWASHFDSPRHRAILGVLQEAAEAHSASIAAVSLAWLLAQPAVTSALCSVRSLAQLEEILGAVALDLDADWVARLRAAAET